MTGQMVDLIFLLLVVEEYPWIVHIYLVTDFISFSTIAILFCSGGDCGIMVSSSKIGGQDYTPWKLLSRYPSYYCSVVIMS